ncbi:MAG TPA: N-acetylmuramoyl-L-alanine amidase, partial [Acetomicrobium sp.]|nr:N-acetylmuramoyl-L-alanine amidase [Acetomicrobium sp.]
MAAKDVVYAAEKWILWHGVENLGYVLVLKVNEHNLAPIDVVAAKLKLEVSSNEKSFLAKKGENTLELVPGAAVAKRDGHNIIPLTSIPTYKDGHWWLEANTTLKLLTPLVGDGKTLKWAGKTEATTDDFVVSDVVVRGNVEKIEQSSSASFATKIVGLRWGQWEDRVRLVLDLSSDVSPFVEKKPSKLVLKFNGVLVDDLVKD